MKWTDFSKQDVIAALTKGFPDDLQVDIPDYNPEPESRITFELKATRGHQIAFTREENLDFKFRTTDNGHMFHYAAISGYNGLGLLYMANLCDFIKVLDFEMVRIFAAGHSGSYVWGLAGANTWWVEDDHFDVNDYFKSTALGRLFEARTLMPEHRIMELEEQVRTISPVHDFGIARLAQCDDLLPAESGHVLAGELYQGLQAYFGAGKVPIGAYLCMDQGWYGYFNPHDQNQMQHLRNFAAQKFRPQ